MTQALTHGRTEEKNKFIDLRARGYSYSKIAEELEVSKATLTLWDRELKEEINKLKALQLDELYTKYFMLKEARVSQLGSTLEKINAQLDTRDLSDLPDDKLLDFKIKYMQELKEEYVEPQEDKTLTKLNAQGILTELITLLARLRSGEISKEQAYRENFILASVLKAYEAHALEEKLNHLEGIIKGNK
jgi:hypothetical protein